MSLNIYNNNTIEYHRECQDVEISRKITEFKQSTCISRISRTIAIWNITAHQSLRVAKFIVDHIV